MNVPARGRDSVELETDGARHAHLEADARVAAAVARVLRAQLDAARVAQVFDLDHVAVAPLLERGDLDRAAFVARQVHVARNVGDADRAVRPDVVAPLKILRARDRV